MADEKELTPLEKFQQEYNTLCAEFGHNDAQMKALEERQITIREKIKKLRNKATNLPKKDQEKQNDTIEPTA